VTRALLGIALCSLILCAAPAAAKQRSYAFLITNVSMSEVMSFHGDGGPACARAGVCGYSGTVSYGFGGGDGFAAFILRGRRVLGTGDFFYEGLTSATVQAPGGGAPCTDKVLWGFDGFEVEGTPGRMRILFHAPVDVPEYLDTYCAGPSDVDMWHARALPVPVLSERSLRSRIVRIHESTTRPFHAGPFEGTLTFQIDAKMRRARHPAWILDFLAPDL
jgi:hypothetical protein